VEYEQNGADRAEYGKTTLKKLSKALQEALGKGFSADSLEQMRRFFIVYKGIMKMNEKSETMFRISTSKISETTSRKSLTELPRALGASEPSGNLISLLSSRLPLGWSHYVTLLNIDSSIERRFYEIEASSGNWSVRELERQISSSLFERLALSRNKNEIRKLAKKGLVVKKAADIIKNPLVLEFLGLDEKPSYSESDLESAIIDKLQHFLLELGKGFLFEARQKRFTFENDHYYIDLVFYNRLLRCYVLFDLKRDKLTHDDLGQMQMYVNYYDRHIKTEDELPTIGIILCRRKNNAMVELTLPKEANIFASKYQLYLPSKEELKNELEKIETELRSEG
jgi:predicted nuclease of restriction endonuclease-like (RecB) superfamily